MLDRLAGLPLLEIAATGRLAELQVQTAAWLERHQSQLNEADLLRFRRIQARSLAAAGRQQEAGSIFKQLVEAYPDDGQMQEEYAEWLLTEGSRSSVEAAQAKWREIERRSPPGSDRWFRAKYALASAQHRLGNSEQAVKIITVTQVLHPELGGPVMKARFLKLLEQCQPYAARRAPVVGVQGIDGGPLARKAATRERAHSARQTGWCRWAKRAWARTPVRRASSGRDSCGRTDDRWANAAPKELPSDNCAEKWRSVARPMPRVGPRPRDSVRRAKIVWLPCARRRVPSAFGRLPRQFAPRKTTIQSPAKRLLRQYVSCLKVPFDQFATRYQVHFGAP